MTQGNDILPGRISTLAALLFLTALTVALFGPEVTHDFINYDVTFPFSGRLANAPVSYGLSGARRLIRMVGEDQPPAPDALTAAYAKTGRFEAAAKTASQARHLAESFHMASLGKQIGRREDLYRTGWPYREGRMP